MLLTDTCAAMKHSMHRPNPEPRTMQSENFSAVMFDLGDTLFEPLDSSFVTRNLEDVAVAASVDIKSDQLLSKFRSTRNRFERELSESRATFYLHREFVRNVLSSTFDSFDCSLTSGLLDKFCDAQRDVVVENLRPRKDCTETLKRLRKNGYRLGIVSNIDNEWIEPIRKKWELDLLVDEILSSEQACSCKPSSSIFLQACRLIDVKPQESLFVGDSFANDVIGSRNVGMHPIWFDTGLSNLDQGETVQSVTELSELLNILVRRKVR